MYTSKTFQGRLVGPDPGEPVQDDLLCRIVRGAVAVNLLPALVAVLGLGVAALALIECVKVVRRVALTLTPRRIWRRPQEPVSTGAWVYRLARPAAERPPMAAPRGGRPRWPGADPF